jgi:hypothetical protein
VVLAASRWTPQLPHEALLNSWPHGTERVRGSRLKGGRSTEAAVRVRVPASRSRDVAQLAELRPFFP